MRFSILAAFAALASVTVAQTKATVVVQSINTLTVKSESLIVPAKQLSITNAPLLLLGQGPWPKVICGLSDIVSTATTYIGTMSAGTKTTYVGAEATAVANAFRVFVKVHQELLDALIGTSGFITRIPFVGPPVAAVLRSIESVVDTLAFEIIDTLEATVAAALKTEYTGLQVKLEAAITTFS